MKTSSLLLVLLTSALLANTPARDWWLIGRDSSDVSSAIYVDRNSIRKLPNGHVEISNMIVWPTDRDGSAARTHVYEFDCAAHLTRLVRGEAYTANGKKSSYTGSGSKWFAVGHQTSLEAIACTGQTALLQRRAGTELPIANGRKWLAANRQQVGGPDGPPSTFKETVR